MNRLSARLKAIISPLLIAMILVGALLPLAVVSAMDDFRDKQDGAWSFGLISDTQWTVPPDGMNPNTTAANIIKQVDQQFIAAHVDLVIAVGDTVDVGSATNIGTRALYAQDLYNAGIGFYPLRGNHEAAETPPDLTSGPEMLHAFPQIGTGLNNTTPADITIDLIPEPERTNNPPAQISGQPFKVGRDFTAPDQVNQENNSVSYAFRYRNATFMLLDQFDVNGSYLNSTIPQQQGWINDTLHGRPEDTHAFVFTHKNILGGNHKDNLFGGQVVATDPGDGNGVDTNTLTPDQLAALNAKIAAENDFVASMQANKVDIFISGHDHHHYYSFLTSPNRQSSVRQLIAQSDSSKFYVPKAPVSALDQPIQQDLGRIGYYIFTLNGPMVTVDYYGDSAGGNNYKGPFNFVKMSSFQYSINGTTNLVPQGGSYTMTDTIQAESRKDPEFRGTSMAVLSGTNSSTAATNYGKALNAYVTTGWSPRSGWLSSDILSLDGMAKIAGKQTDPYVLSLSIKPTALERLLMRAGVITVLSRNAEGKWVKAVSLNAPADEKFVFGPWKAEYGLGTYGVDLAKNSVWAVVNYNGDFAVGQTLKK
ncbi:MAG TPA: metallophosphoesterase [Anaerolineaceae bacterium]|nr:metallophosphoesterase [Anaerolineaceae bacterium]